MSKRINDNGFEAQVNYSDMKYSISGISVFSLSLFHFSFSVFGRFCLFYKRIVILFLVYVSVSVSV